MDALPSTRSTRARPAKPPLSEDAVVDAALAVCRDEGLRAVTMRRVAAELDTGPASLYVYIRNRSELLRAMFDRVASSVPHEPVDPARWREQVHALVFGWLTVMEAHPGLAEVAFADPLTSERTLLAAEYLFELLLAGGVAVPDAAWACDALPLVATATAMESDVRRAYGHTGEETVAQIDDAFAALPPERFPLLTRYRVEMLAGDPHDRFRFQIDTFLDGLLARAAR